MKCIWSWLNLLLDNPKYLNFSRKKGEKKKKKKKEFYSNFIKILLILFFWKPVKPLFPGKNPTFFRLEIIENEVVLSNKNNIICILNNYLPVLYLIWILCGMWPHGVVVIVTAQLHSLKLEILLVASWNLPWLKPPTMFPARNDTSHLLRANYSTQKNHQFIIIETPW